MHIFSHCSQQEQDECSNAPKAIIPGNALRTVKSCPDFCILIGLIEHPISEPYTPAATGFSTFTRYFCSNSKYAPKKAKLKMASPRNWLRKKGMAIS